MNVSMNLPFRQTGLSLIELMIAITLGLVLMTGVSQIFLSSKVVFSTQQGLARIQETGRLAVDFMSRDISAAGYYGCHRPIPTTLPFTPEMLNGIPLVIGGLHGNFDVSLIGFNSIATMPGGVGASVGNLGVGVTPEPANDILVVRSAPLEGFTVTSSDTQNLIMAVPAATLLVPPLPCAGNLCAGAAVVVSDCTQARVFQIPAVAGSLTLSAAGLRLNHPVWPPLPRDGRDGADFRALSEVRPLNTTVYFLGRRPGAPGTTEISLWQRTNLQNPVELLEGVEQMRIRYATTTNAIFRRASDLNANDWPLVSAVRLELVVRSIENNVVSEPQPYTFDGALVNPAVADPLDRRMRQVFITTVAKRNFN